MAYRLTSEDVAEMMRFVKNRVDDSGLYIEFTHQHGNVSTLHGARVRSYWCGGAFHPKLPICKWTHGKLVLNMVKIEDYWFDAQGIEAKESVALLFFRIISPTLLLARR